MNTQAQQVLQTALALPPHEREEVAEMLLISLGEPTADELEVAWGEEIKRRLESIDRGDVKLIPWDDTIREMRERLNG